MKRVRPEGSAGTGGNQPPQGSSTTSDEGNQPKTKQQKTSNAPQTPPPQGGNTTSLRVQDALTYLDLVKKTYIDKPSVYARFLEIMKEFKNHVIDTPGVIQRVSELFKPHSQLILGFNSFLPPGYRIELAETDNETVITLPPSSTSAAASRENQTSPTPSANQAQTPTSTTGKKKVTKRAASPTTVSAAPASSSAKPAGDRGIDFEQAITYVTKIKKRFADNPTTYKSFLDILHNYQKEQTTIKKVYEQVSYLFREHQDLLNEFAQFLPMPVEAKSKSRKIKKQQQAQQIQESAAEKKRRPSRTASKSKQYEDFEYEADTPAFFTELRQRLGDSDYNQILKCINMYTSDIIDRSELLDMISESQPLRKHSDLFKKLKKLISTNSIGQIINQLHHTHTSLKHENLIKKEREISTASQSKPYGPSYRVMNKKYQDSTSSERTELCNQVLNDEFVSVPAGSEESRDIQKKSQYDEIIFQCEDDRTELDIVIEQNISTIKFLTPFADNIKEKEELNFNIEDLRDIHRASINRIYAEKGAEVLEGLRKNPAVAIPIIYRRLKQKDEEWRKARKELNRFWHDIYDKNYQKSMESQYNLFKTMEKKKLQPKNIFKETKERHEYVRPVTFDFSDKSIHDDIYYLLINLTHDLTDEEVSNINQLWHLFLIPFLDLSANHYKVSHQYDVVIKEVPPGEQPNQAPLRYFANLFESQPSLTESSSAFPPIVEQPISKDKPRNTVFYGNSSFLLFFRYYCALYEKLLRAKEACKKALRLKEKSVPTATVLQEHDALLEKSNFGNERKDREKEKALEDFNNQVNGTNDVSHEELYAKFITVMIQFLNGLGTPQSYDDDCKRILGHDAYTSFTSEKVFVDFQKHVYNMISEQNDLCTSILQAFKYEYQRVNRFLDNSYRLNVHKILGDGDEVGYQFEYNHKTSTAKIDEVDPPETDMEKMEAEERALRYVQQFLLTQPSEEMGRNNKLFLKRNMRAMSADRLHNAIVRNRLECKICIATFKLYYVEDTEDLLFRKSRADVGKQKRSNRWNAIHEKLFKPSDTMDTSN